MAYYINSIFTNETLRSDIKELIPDMTMRRRMSRVVKMGVTTGRECLGDFGLDVDAIITATGLGCLADSEKFLANIIENDEQMLNPTPFIQSTFNTIGAQIALLCGNHSYNMTYTHGAMSFESALLDAMMRLDEGVSKAVLVGVVDEKTPTQEHIMERMGLYRRSGRGAVEGAMFFVLTAQPTANSIAIIKDMRLFVEGESSAEAMKASEQQSSRVLFAQETVGGSSHTVIGMALAAVVDNFDECDSEVDLVNDFGGVYRSVITIEKMSRTE